jgi:leucyl aminopeptidase
MPKPLPGKAVKIEPTIHALFEDEVEAALSGLKPAQAAFLRARKFTGKTTSLIVLPGDGGKGEGSAMQAFFGLGPRAGYTPLTFRALASQLPAGRWTLKADDGLDRHAIHAAWHQGAYRFDRYKSGDPKETATLDDGDILDPGALEAEVRAHNLVRDLVNTPANDMGPADIADAAREVALRHGAEFKVITGDDLLTQNYPAIHAVGRAAADDRAPRFIEISWQGPGPETPVIVLVGKGVTFDTGGLNIKTAGMGLMKKDMGGAAHALALGDWIMNCRLPVSLHILIPAVENSISASAMRPGDILSSRAGLTIEMGNSDAEGRLILADALARASELEPNLTIDFATLTGAARVALGPEVIPFYCDDEDMVRRLEVAALANNDPVWRMPLWAGYSDALDSDIADIRNDPAAWAQAGSVTAAMFLQRFAPKTGVWVHFDIYAWNPRGRTGWPVGAEAQALRAVYHLIGGL